MRKSARDTDGWLDKKIEAGQAFERIIEERASEFAEAIGKAIIILRQGGSCKYETSFGDIILVSQKDRSSDTTNPEGQQQVFDFIQSAKSGDMT